MNNEYFRIKRFDPTNIKPNRAFLFIGKKGTGKTTLMRDMLYYHRRIPDGIVMTATNTDYWSEVMPRSFVYEEYDPSVLKRVVTRQIRKNENNRPSTVVVLDDVMYDKNIGKDKNLRGILMNQRHWKIAFLFAMQYAMDIPPALRSNIDYVFVCREPIMRNREVLYKNFFGVFPTYKLFCDALDAYTRNYEVLVLDNTVQSNSVTDCVFAYRSRSPVPSFKLGNSWYWKLHRSREKKKDTEAPVDLTLDFQDTRSGMKMTYANN